MTPQEKVDELLEKFESCEADWRDQYFAESERIKMALVCVDEIIKYQDSLVGMLDTNDGTSPIFWEEVKRILETM